MTPQRTRSRTSGVTTGLTAIAFWQFATFLMLLLLIWLNEVEDLTSLIYHSAPKPMDVPRASLLSACVIFTAIIAVGYTYSKQRRIISDLITVCAKCHRVRLDEDVWQTVEAYLTDHRRVLLSHGLCPRCYEEEIKALESR
jgi:hypothetical protein